MASTPRGAQHSIKHPKKQLGPPPPQVGLGACPMHGGQNGMEERHQIPLEEGKANDVFTANTPLPDREAGTAVGQPLHGNLL